MSQVEDPPEGALPEPPAGGGGDVPSGDGGADDEFDVPRRGRTGLVVSAVVAVVALALVALLATREPGTDREASSPLVGRPAPPLAAPTLDGGTFDIADHRGQWVVVNIFATWCQPCRQEHPELVAFDEAHEEAGDAELVSVLFDDRPGTARDYFERNGGEWPVVLDESGRIATTYGVARVPETYVVAPDGTVVAKLIGGVTQARLDREIADAAAAGVGVGEAP